MLAGRLALQWGIVDVQAWLRSLPRGALNFWEAFDSVEPIGEHWRQAATVAWSASLDKFKEVRDPDEFMPPRFRPPPQRLELPTADEMANQFRSLAGALGLKVTDGNNDQRG